MNVVVVSRYCIATIVACCDTVAMLQLENKFRQEMEEHKQRLDKEYESLSATFYKDLDKLRAKHHQELEKKVSRWLRLVHVLPNNQDLICR